MVTAAEGRLAGRNGRVERARRIALRGNTRGRNSGSRHKTGGPTKTTGTTRPIGKRRKTIHRPSEGASGRARRTSGRDLRRGRDPRSRRTLAQRRSLPRGGKDHRAPAGTPPPRSRRLSEDLETTPTGGRPSAVALAEPRLQERDTAPRGGVHPVGTAQNLRARVGVEPIRDSALRGARPARVSRTAIAVQLSSFFGRGTPGPTCSC